LEIAEDTILTKAIQVSQSADQRNWVVGIDAECKLEVGQESKADLSLANYYYFNL